MGISKSRSVREGLSTRKYPSELPDLDVHSQGCLRTCLCNCMLMSISGSFHGHPTQQNTDSAACSDSKGSFLSSVSCSGLLILIGPVFLVGEEESGHPFWTTCKDSPISPFKC